MKHYHVCILNIQFYISDVFDTEEVLRCYELDDVVGPLNFFLYLPFLLLHAGSCRRRLGHDLSEVDFVLLADVFKHFGREVLEHFLEYLDPANELPVFVFPFNFAKDVIFVVGFGITKTLFAGVYVLLDQILETFLDSQLDILRHNHHSGLVSKQFALNLVQILEYLHVVFGESDG